MVIVMGYRYLKNSVALTRNIISHFVKEGYIVADCTVGNGHDTLLLARMVGKGGRVYGFDIQSVAIDRTQNKLMEHGLEQRVILINSGHENIGKHVEDRLHLAIYNLGYLPGGDKKITTIPDTTLESIAQTLTLLYNNGLLLVTCYTGHEGGEIERQRVEEYLMSLDQKRFNVLKFDFINQRNNPPVLYGVEKL